MMDLANMDPWRQFLPTPAVAELSVWVPVGIGPQERLYFQTPDWYTHTMRVIRVRLDDRGIPPLLDRRMVEASTLTLVDQDGQNIVDAVPLMRFVPNNVIPPDPAPRASYLFRPFRWDPMKSFVKTWQGQPAPELLTLLVDYVDE